MTENDKSSTSSTSSTNPTNEQPVGHIPNFIGQGEYLAFAGYFACRDEREHLWRLSRISELANKMMKFDYIGTFATRSGVLEYIAANPYQP